MLKFGLGTLLALGAIGTASAAVNCNTFPNNTVNTFVNDDVEAIGLVKFDFLGLTTLTILDLTLAYVRRLDPHFSLTLETLPLDDAKAYDIFKRADTAAIFQFESRGMRELLKRAKPDRLEDLIALNALYRPGPMDLIPDYIERKHGLQRVEYLHPTIEPILSETYGIMVYQEQVMRIAQEVGAYSLGSADLLRRAMGKKKPEEMAKQRTIFVDGARSKAVDENVATELFDLMEKFAGYGFNKSHSAAYALVAYQTAYFKAHHPAAFMAANLTAVMDDTDKVKELIEDCKAIGLKIEAPNVNTGAWRFEPVDPRTIRYGLGGIKGTGKGAIEAILAKRSQAGPFASLFDFCARVEKGVVNRRVVEALVRSGAFDAIDADRAKLFATVGRALEAAEKAAADIGQESLFGGLLGDGGGSAPQIDYVPSRPWSERERLAAEKLALGYYFSGHLFTEYAAEARRLAPTRLADVKGGNGRDTLRLAGIIVSARTQNTKRGRMGVIMLDDGSAQLELMVYAETFDRRRATLKEDTLVFVSGRVREFDGRISVSAEDVMDLAEARAKAQAALRIDMERGTDVARLKNLLAPYRVEAHGNPGNGLSGCRVLVSYRNGVGCAELVFSEAWRVRPDDALLAELKQQAAVRAAAFAYG